MRVYFAGHGPSFMADALVAEGASRHLLTYAWPDVIRTFYSGVWERLEGCEVLMDSGAFTAHSRGREITVAEYAGFMQGFTEAYGSRLAAVEFMSLDVIGDQVASWRNYEALLGRGCEVVPVLTYGASQADMERVAEFDRFALGGLVPMKMRPKKMRAWLDYVFAYVLSRRRETDEPWPRVHLLGATQPWILERYPVYSCDSSSWTAPVRYKNAIPPALARADWSVGAMPRYGESEAALAANVHLIRSEINWTMELEKHASRLWASRGVEWDE